MSDDAHQAHVLEKPSVTQPAPGSAAASAPAPVLVKRSSPAARTMIGRMLQTLPTALLIVMLAGLAYWGHANDWSIPRFSALFGNGAIQKDDWCDEHGVPESICVECNANLLPKIPSTWCRVHGVHNCPFERPEIAQLPSVPVITQAMLDRAQRALDLKERPENNKKCTLHERRIQLASAEVMEKMGIDVTPVVDGPIVEAVHASGEITFAQPRVAPISTPVAGRVWQLTPQGQLGAEVKRGDLLALVDAAEVGKAKAEFLQAFGQLELKAKVVERMKPLIGNLYSDAHLQEAESARREAEIRAMGAQQALVNLGLPIQYSDVKGLAAEELTRRLQFFGVPAEIARTLDPKTTTASLLPVLAARDGVVTAAKVVPGQMVDPTSVLFVVSDTSAMWLILNVKSEDVPYLRARDVKTAAPGQTVRFQPDGSKQEVSGELVWISKSVDEKTRTVQVRADLPNPDGRLLANTFGRGRIILREEKAAIVVPNEAVHWETDCNVVFVRDKNFFQTGAPKVFHVRNVRPGVKNGEYTEIIAGLLPGEVVATKNSASLRAELLKNSLGAG